MAKDKPQKDNDSEEKNAVKGEADVQFDDDGNPIEATKEGGKKKLILIIGGVVLLLAAIGGGLFFTGIIGGGEAAESTEAGKHSEEHDEKHEDGHSDGKAKDGKAKDDKKGKSKKGDGYEDSLSSSAFLKVPPMVVNLNTEDGVPRFLRLTVQLELEDSGDKSSVEAILPRVIDQFQTYLRELRVRDLRGSAGIYRLQMELLWRVNQAAEPAKIKDILFQEILIQ